MALVVGAGDMSMVIAERLGQSHRVVLASLNSREIEQGRARLHASGVVSAGLQCDITDGHSVAELSGFIQAQGRLAALAHVAALSLSAGDWRKIFAVNLIGAALIEEAMRPAMAPFGAAVFISSLAAHQPTPDEAVTAVLDSPLAVDALTQLEQVVSTPLTPGIAYGLSKVGLNRLVRRQARLWGEREARLVSLSPGLIDTVMGAAEDEGSSKATKARLRARLPLRRDGTMADIADAVDFLVSRRASYITGTDLLVDGGLSASMQSADS
jgi:NAD(P)-dependent dehydrogenase (short-subunit alcohol dehydrogenase family)